MNATSLDELRSAATNREVRDEKMEQVRQLLFGDHAREVSTRFMLLESRVRELEMSAARQPELLEARLREIETGVSRQLEAISQRIEQLASTSCDERRTAFDELSRNIHELGERIGVMAKR